MSSWPNTVGLSNFFLPFGDKHQHDRVNFIADNQPYLQGGPRIQL